MARRTTTSTSAADWDGAFRDAAGRRPADAAIRRCWSPCRRSTSRRWRRPDRHVLYVLEPMPNLDGSVDWTAEREPARKRLVERSARAGLSDRRRRSSASSTRSTGRRREWSGARRSRCRTASSRPGPFRPAQHRAPRARPRVRRLRHGARRRRADGADLRKAGRATRRRVGDGRMTITLEESYARCRELNKRYGTTYYWSTCALPADQAAPRVGAVRVLPSRRRHRRRPRRRRRRRSRQGARRLR